MGMTHQEAIETIKAHYPDERYTMLREVLDMAMDALKAQTPRVMTLEEIKPAAHGGCMYWMELRQGLKCFPVLMIEQKANRTLEFAAVFNNGYGTVTVGRFKPDEYNAVWRCWNFRPTDEQREAVKWDDD